MSALLYVEGLGRATRCVAAGSHRPTPRRYVWHHILPQVCGGTTDPANLAEVCDNCHYSIHGFMYASCVGKPLGRGGTAGQRALAAQGYAAAVAAGTQNLIPDEGSAVE